MKNHIKIFVVFLIIISTFFFTSKTEAIIAKVFNLNVIVKTEGGDDNFKYDFTVYSYGPNPSDHKIFSLQSQDGVANYKTYTLLNSGTEVFLTQETMLGWQTSTPICTSTDPKIIINPITGGVKIIANPFHTLTCTFTNTKSRNPVIIIPGILSSYLNRNDNNRTELWPNIIKVLFGLPGDRYLDELALNQIGQPNTAYPLILATDIFRKIGSNDFFVGLINKLITQGYKEGKDLFVFPYDWRLDIRSINLKDKITQILEQTEAEKVNIIAHSMGGLLAKYYIQHENENKVDKFIDIATPHLGAPASFKTLTFGDDMGIKFGIFGLNSDEVKKITQNMPSAYQLLPSQNYFSTSSPDYKYYLYDMDDVDKDNLRGRLTYDQTKKFLKNIGRNDVLLDNAPSIHNDLDFMNPADYSVEAYNIVGCGVPTIGKFFLLGQKNLEGKHYDLAYISGDGTVPERSARSLPVINEYQVSGIKHSSLPSAPDVNSLVVDLLEKGSSTTIIPNTDKCELPDGYLLSFHGPTTLDIYDQNNNHAGPLLGSGYEQSIPNIFYDYIENNVFAYLPLVDEYKIKISSKRRGRASSHIKKIKNGEIVTTAYYNNIPLVSASTTLEVNLDNSEPQIILNLLGDGNSAQILLPSATTTGDSLLDLDPPVTSINITPSATSTTVGFESTDTDILETEYSLDGGETYNEATSTFIVSEIGTTTIIYQSTDTAGNIENPQQVDVYISPTLPTAVSTTTATSSTVVSEPESISTSTPSAISTITNAIEVVGRNRGVDKNKVSKRELISTTTTALTFVPIVEPEVVTIPVEIVTSLKASTAGKILPTESKINDLYYASAIGVGPKAKGYIWWILFIIIILIFLIKICLKRK